MDVTVVNGNGESYFPFGDGAWQVDRRVIPDRRCDNPVSSKFEEMRALIRRIADREMLAYLKGGGASGDINSISFVSGHID